MALPDLLKAARSIDLDRNEVIRYVQEAYSTFVRRRDLFKLRALSRVTGIKPELSERLVQEAYAAIFRDDLLVMSGIETLQEITGIRPAENVMQEAYAAHVAAGKDVCNLRSIQEITGIKPKLPEEVVQRAYLKYAKERKFTDFESLQQLTGVKPSEEAYITILRTLMPT